jgi:osmotically inducible protein OsmC
MEACRLAASRKDDSNRKELIFMATRKGYAKWEGNLKRGKGLVEFGDGAFAQPYSFSSRFEKGKGTNPEELIAAAHAACFSMALSHLLSESGFDPKRVFTTATVHLDKAEEGFEITTIDLRTEAEVDGIDEATFKEHAETAKENCPVSKALAGCDIHLEAVLSE